MTRFQGTFQGHTTGGGDGKGILALIAVVAVLILGGGGSVAFAGIAGALAGLLDCLAVVIGTVIVGGSVAWFATRRQRAANSARVLEALSRGQQAREDEIEARHARRAAVTAQSQAAAWAPMIAAVVAGLRPQPEPQLVRVTAETVEQQEIDR